MSSFQLVALSPERFSSLFLLDTTGLALKGITRVTADSKPGYPCRVSLQDAEPGEELLLMPYEHQPALSPYRASGPIYVRAGSRESRLHPGEIPPYVSLRMISVRAYDAHHLMTDAEISPGDGVAQEIQRQFGNPAVSYIHLHNAKRGCFSCRVERLTCADQAPTAHLSSSCGRARRAACRAARRYGCRRG